jgi:competence protein ComEA
MDQIAQWRPAEPPTPDTATSADAGRDRNRWQAVMLGAIGTAVLGAAGFMLWATTPQPQLLLEPLPAGLAAAESPAGYEQASPQAVIEDLLVDVEGAVERPGLHRLSPGSRVGDAIAAAGGYSTQVDIAAAAERLNLAQRIADGDKIHVPARGDEDWMPQPTAPAAAPEVSAPTAGGLIDINTATEAQLDTLPGIGPVTAAKIIAARQEAAFASVDELLGRKVVGPATFEKIRELVTVGP